MLFGHCHRLEEGVIGRNGIDQSEEANSNKLVPTVSCGGGQL